jgi:hypothetical protein
MNLFAFIKQLLAFGGNGPWYTSKGVWCLIIGIILAAYTVVAGGSITDPQVQEAAKRILEAWAAAAGILRAISAFVPAKGAK